MSDPSAVPSTIDLAAGFPEQTREDWQVLVAAVLNKGRAPDAQLDGAAAEQALRRHLEGGRGTGRVHRRARDALSQHDPR